MAWNLGAAHPCSANFDEMHGREALKLPEGTPWRAGSDHSKWGVPRPISVVAVRAAKTAAAHG